MTVIDAHSGARVPSSLPAVTVARTLPGRAVAFVTPERQLFVWRPGARQRAIDRDVVGPISPSPGEDSLSIPTSMDGSAPMPGKTLSTNIDSIRTTVLTIIMDIIAYQTKNVS